MDPLLEPFAFGQITVKNRIATTAHAPFGYTTDGLPNERYLRYHEEKAAGGLGLLMFGGSSWVAPDGPSFFDSLNAGHPEISAGYRELAGRVHRHGAKAIVQISHLGRRGDDKRFWVPTISPSPIRERAHRAFPKEMEDFDFTRVLEAYARAAKYAKEGQLDGIEIAALSGHLPDSFLASRANRRDDEYGGSRTNRARFLLQVIDAVRSEVGADFTVGIRLPGEEAPEGLSREECLEIAQLVSATKQLDYLNVMYGSGFSHRELGDQIPPSGTQLGKHLPLALAIREAVTEPVFHAGRINDVATARHALRDGYVDIVGMTRAHIADPHIVRKLEAGDDTRIRPCVGASHCLTGTETLCIHNPATSRESTIPQLVEPGAGGLKVTIVGGGPAGLEAARVSAERGHDVTLFEATGELGGQVIPMTRPKRQSEKRSITEWLAAEARLAGAKLRVNEFVDDEDLRATNSDVIIIATGGMPNEELPEGGGALATSMVDVLSQRPPSEKRILVVDDHGTEDGLITAEYLAEGMGNDITIVTVDEALGHDVGHTLSPGYKRRLLQAGVVTVPDTELLGIRREAGQLVAQLRHTLTDATSERMADLIVLDQGTLPLDDVYFALKPHSRNRGEIDQQRFIDGLAQPEVTDAEGDFRLYRIGDAVAHRGIHAAIFDARRLCMNL